MEVQNRIGGRKMKKRSLFLLALICAATLAVACGKQKAAETSGSAASGTESTTVASSETAVAEAARRTVTDDSGAVTEIPEKIDRIVVGDVCISARRIRLSAFIRYP